jgi:hypothetical protein
MVIEGRSENRNQSEIKTAQVRALQNKYRAKKVANADYTVRLLSFRTDCAERILRAPSSSHPQKHVGASLDTLCA